MAIEVPRLAQSAAAASADIKALIETSAREVANGTCLFPTATTSLFQVQTGLKDNHGLIEKIAIAGGEQAGAIDEVGKAISTVDDMTQRCLSAAAQRRPHSDRETGGRA